MAPRKSNVTRGDDKAKSSAVVTTPPARRQTRSMDRLTRSQTRERGAGSSSTSSSKLMTYESPEKRKKKTTGKEGGATKKIKKEEGAAVEIKKEKEDDEEEAAAEEESSVVKKIVIEHCKQCKSFTKRAQEAKEGLEKAVPGIVVTVNADKPRRGCFEIREEGGEAFISLLEMKRPFTPMKDLNMEEVIANIVERLK